MVVTAFDHNKRIEIISAFLEKKWSKMISKNEFPMGNAANELRQHNNKPVGLWSTEVLEQKADYSHDNTGFNKILYLYLK